MTQDVFDYFAIYLARVAYQKGGVGSTARKMSIEYSGYYEDKTLERDWLGAAAAVRDFLKDNLSRPASDERCAAECQTLMNAIERYHHDGTVRRHALMGPQPGIANHPTEDKVGNSVTNIACYFEALRVGTINASAAALPVPTTKREPLPIDRSRLLQDGKFVLIYLLVPLVVGPVLSYLVVSAMNLWDYAWISITEGSVRADIKAGWGFGNPMRASIGSTLGIGQFYGSILFLIAIGSRLFRGEWPHE